MIIRIRSKEGACRIEASHTDSLSVLIEKALTSMNLASTVSKEACSLSLDAEGKSPLESLEGIKHGEMIFLQLPRTNSTEKPSTQEDEIDRILAKRPGLISRPKNAQLCRHSTNAMCEHCLPLEPFDEAYAVENKIKHLSFHSHLRKLGLEPEPTHQTKQYGTFVHTLEEPDYIPAKCPNHSANAMCSKCQPSAITLQPQSFRMVDHVEFQSSTLLESFIDWWRKTGYQRFGILYGYYAPYEKVPLGIKAVVVAIYEPAQDCSVDGFELLQGEELDKCALAMKNLAEGCSLQPVGMIFTDLQDAGQKDGTVLCKRNASTYFVTGFEAVFTAHYQNAYPSPCKYSKTARFGSKWVSVIVSGDENGGISLFPYQVSNVCTAMVSAELVEATSDACLVSVAQEDSAKANSRYIPQVFYNWKNEYGIMVQKSAEPTFPVDYLVVSLTHGFVNDSSNAPMLASFNTAVAFPVSNRPELSPKPSLEAVAHYLNQFHGEYGIQVFSNFHLLLFLGCCGLFEADTLRLLYKAVSEKNEAFLECFFTSSCWLSFLVLVMEENISEAAAAERQVKPWTCAQCTFINYNGQQDCEMCSLPR
jgi:nuclear protein localization family protein 4